MPLWGYIWPKVSLTWSSSKPGHKMSLLGTSDQRSAWPEVVSNLAMRCLYWGYDQRSAWPKYLTKFQPDLKPQLQGDPSDLSAKMTLENLNTLYILGLASQRSFLQKTKKSIKLRMNRWHTVQSNERCVFISVYCHLMTNFHEVQNKTHI